MEVQSYHTPPIGIDNPININENLIQIKNQTLNFTEPIQQFINNTIEILNQTVKQGIQKNKQQNSDQLSYTNSYQNEWNLLYFIRVFFYIIVVLKVIELVFNKRRKMDIKERVYKKYIFSHAQIIRQFDDQDRKVMETTLNNTIKNAYLQKNYPKLSKKPSTKKVNFFENRNQYFEPKRNSQQNIQNLSPLQQFLSRTSQQPLLVKIQQMKRQQQEPSQPQFQIIETIKQSTTIQNSEIVVKKQVDSIITTNTESTQLLNSFQQYALEKTLLQQTTCKED